MRPRVQPGKAKTTFKAAKAPQAKLKSPAKKTANQGKAKAISQALALKRLNKVIFLCYVIIYSLRNTVVVQRLTLQILTHFLGISRNFEKIKSRVYDRLYQSESWLGEKLKMDVPVIFFLASKMEYQRKSFWSRQMSKNPS